MKTTKIATVVGARPQFVKAATISRALAKRQDAREILIHTGQHSDENMSEVFFKEMSIPKPDFNLGVQGGGHGAMTGEMMKKLEEVFTSEKPDIVLVYGDTNSTLAGALTAAKLHIPIAHVEAGLRSFNMRMPEEVNRILTDRVSSWLFCPTDHAVENLMREGYASFPAKIVKSGDVMYDAALFYSKVSAQGKKLNLDLPARYYLCTLHRAENTDNVERLGALIKTLREIAKDTPIVLPLHPRTQKAVNSLGMNTDGLMILPPVGYFDMLELLKSCSLVLTDSGGLQKEAYFFGKRCLTLRDETEWVELVEVGQNVLCGADSEKILSEERRLRSATGSWAEGLYGDGHAAEQIVTDLLK